VRDYEEPGWKSQDEMNIRDRDVSGKLFARMKSCEAFEATEWWTGSTPHPPSPSFAPLLPTALIRLHI
jgi:hypothetical protein